MLMRSNYWAIIKYVVVKNRLNYLYRISIATYMVVYVTKYKQKKQVVLAEISNLVTILENIENKVTIYNPLVKYFTKHYVPVDYLLPCNNSST